MEKAPSDQQKALPAPTTESAEVYAPYIAMTGVEALRQATPTSFILGQAQNGALCKVDLHNAQHMGIVGAPGCGKTVSTAYSTGFSVFNFGGRLIVLDGKDGIDWKMWARVAEHHMMDSGVLADQMHYVHQEYVRRMAMVSRYNVPHLSKLEHPDFPPLYVIVEEYGANASGMSKSDTAFCDNVIDEMTRKGRVTDIHLVIIDQDPRYWSQLLLMCTKAKILYRVGPNQGNIVGDYHAQELPDTGVFRYQKVEYKAWLMEGERDELLKRIPTNPWPPLMPDTTDWKQPLFPGNVPNPPIVVQKPGQIAGQMSKRLSASTGTEARPGNVQKGSEGAWKPVDPQEDAGMGARGQTGVVGRPTQSGSHSPSQSAHSGESVGRVSTGVSHPSRPARMPDSPQNAQNRQNAQNNSQNAENAEWDTEDTWGATVDADGWIRMPGSGNVSGDVPKDVQENAHSESSQIVPQTFVPRPPAPPPLPKPKTDKQIRVLEYFDKNAKYDEVKQAWIFPSVRTMAEETGTVFSYVQSLKVE